MAFPPDESAPILDRLVSARPGGATPRLIIVHATRGANTQAAQYGATKNWFVSDGNRGLNNDGTRADWGGAAHVVISNEGQLCRFIDDSRAPRFSAAYGANFPPLGWSADDWGLSMELAQSDKQEDFADATIERAAAQAADWCRRFSIPPVRLGRIDQSGAIPTISGIVGHDETENGRKLSKTDPGSKFPWDDFMGRVVGYLNGTRDPGMVVPPPPPPPREPEAPAVPLAFRRHNGGFVDLALPLANNTFNARQALGYPAQAREIQLQVWTQGTAQEARIYDGTANQNNREAGRVYAPYGIVGPVILGPQGEIFVTLADGVANGSLRVASLGYWG
ncbi:MAG TPA: N-acetylmuramoyl-L-alanine amidase [Dehalococcoidia bacterium]|nr:N-acetylmuramoyl-L-alanine amidase [Dehalococcoidia bacterium]